MYFDYKDSQLQLIQIDQKKLRVETNIFSVLNAQTTLSYQS